MSPDLARTKVPPKADFGGFRGKPGQMPEGWTACSPNPDLAPKFCLETGPAGLALAVTGNGKRECFGYIRRPVRLDPGKTYRLQVELRADGLEDVHRHLLHGVFGKDFNNGVFTYSRDRGRIIGENCFDGPDKQVDAEIRLYFRFSANGRVWWDRVKLVPCDAIATRPVTVACREGALPAGAGLSFWEEWLDAAAQRGAGVALLPEMFNGKSPAGTESLDGPSAKLLARKARQWRMYTCASFYERRGNLTYNTAPLFDREGKLAGTYEKCYPYDPELDEGVTPGSRFPVFQADFGRVGVMICYDSWFPDTARLLALAGAELVLFPSAGYFVDLMPARAADNGIWIAASSLSCPAGIWDPSGARAGELQASPTRFAPSSIRRSAIDSRLGMALATLDLSRRYSPHWWGGPMASAPGGRLVRRTSLLPSEEEVASRSKRWWGK